MAHSWPLERVSLGAPLPVPSLGEPPVVQIDPSTGESRPVVAVAFDPHQSESEVLVLAHADAELQKELPVWEGAGLRPGFEVAVVLFDQSLLGRLPAAAAAAEGRAELVSKGELLLGPGPG